MVTTEQFLVQEAGEPRMSCKSQKWFLVALLCTKTTVLLLIVIIVLAVTLVQSQTPQYEGSTMESTTSDLSATTAKVPLAVTTNTTVTMESITSDLSATTSKVLLGVSTSTGVTSQMELSKQGKLFCKIRSRQVDRERCDPCCGYLLRPDVNPLMQKM